MARALPSETPARLSAGGPAAPGPASPSECGPPRLRGSASREAARSPSASHAAPNRTRAPDRPRHGGADSRAAPRDTASRTGFPGEASPVHTSVSLSRLNETVTYRIAYETGGGMDIEFFHQSGAMALGSFDGDAQDYRDFLRGFSFGD